MLSRVNFMLFFCISLVALRPALSQTPEVLLNKTASAAARASGLKVFCSQFYLVDATKVDAVRDLLHLDGSRRFGAELFSIKYHGFLSQYGKEVSSIGAARWCTKQREIYRRSGINDLIGGPLE